MLKSLSVKDFAIIEDLTLEFNKGMTVLTGETGAGKSLIIDTISLLLGARADSDMIRYGKSEATITGTFDNKDDLKDLFSRFGIEIADNIVIERNITESSKNTIKINGTSVTLNELKQISKKLADLHIQNDTYRLFNPDGYLDLLDSLAKSDFNNLLSTYSISLMKYNEAIKEYEIVLKGKKYLEERLEFLKYERDELEEIGLYPNMDIDLEESISKLSNFDKIQNNLSEAYNNLDRNELLDSIYNASKALERIEDYSKEYENNKSKVLDCYYILDEVKSDLYDQLDNLDFDQDELNSLIEKQNILDKAKEKYKKTVNELIEYYNEITLQIDMAENYDETLEEKKNNVISMFSIVKDKALKISSYREKIALELSKNIILECKDLDLDNTLFEVTFDHVDYSNPFDKSIFKENGCDVINFLVSFNKGEPLKPLYKVASGGEASRMMLAFKTIFYKARNVSLMVFDEIDTGVSGQTAKKIANKIYDISKNVQVLCITHLPQVASIGNYHKHIYKELKEGRTKTLVKDLNDDERIEEVAKMLSGDSLSLYALEHAKELLKK